MSRRLRSSVAIPQKVFGPGRTTLRRERIDRWRIGQSTDSAAWQFYESGSEQPPDPEPRRPLIGLYAWRKPGLHWSR